jgi:hypothetical protein
MGGLRVTARSRLQWAEGPNTPQETAIENDKPVFWRVEQRSHHRRWKKALGPNRRGLAGTTSTVLRNTAKWPAGCFRERPYAGSCSRRGCRNKF